MTALLCRGVIEWDESVEFKSLSQRSTELNRKYLPRPVTGPTGKDASLLYWRRASHVVRTLFDIGNSDGLIVRDDELEAPQYPENPPIAWMSTDSSPHRDDSANRASKRSSLDHRFLNFPISSRPVSRHSSLRRTSQRFSQSPVRPISPQRTTNHQGESEVLTQEEGLDNDDQHHPYGLSESLTTEETETYHHNSPVIGRGSHFPTNVARFQSTTQNDDENDEEPARSRPPSVDLVRRGRPAESQLYNFDGDEGEEEEDSEEDGGNFSRSLQIDMKGLFGDAVGNMSISPSSRDVVLASRRGLFVIDLETPLEVPRFLPQGGTWDVADVQWNPNPLRAEYIVSTSSEKLLIWNLLLVGKTSIEHILQAHYRAITDINWHPTECDTVVSIGIDSWIWAWDIRAARKPTFGLSLFESAGTQVKWSRHDSDILASSHGNILAIWDRRKGSLPLQRINAHNSKIYGIDWSHENSSQLITCSLDRTIKVWDINDPNPISYFQPASTFNPVSSISPVTPTQASHTHYNGSTFTNTWNNSRGGTLNQNQGPQQHLPMSTIQTNYPVWRARNLPFGQGVLSLAQRGETALEMYARNRPGQGPVHRFEGHQDVVKEFVWRRGSGPDDFQLITWSKDRTLRFWPIDGDTLSSVGHAPHTPDPDDSSLTRGRTKQRRESDRPQISFRNPPEGNEYLPALSAPIGHRSILAEVRAAPAPFDRPFLLGNYANVSPDEQHSVDPEKARLRRQLQSKKILPSLLASARSQGGKMSRGTKNGAVTKSVGRMQMDTLTWLSSVKVGEATERKVTEDGESRSPFRTDRGSGSLPNSEVPSRAGSKSRSKLREEDEEKLAFVGSPEAETTVIQPMPGDDVLSLAEKEKGRKDTTNESQSLQNELTSALAALNSPRIKLEGAEFKKRVCTFGLHGPWGAGTQMVFIRITFTFPKDYPQAPYPNGVPTIDLEKNPLISPKERTFILRRLTTIKEKKRPCLESCLRFLLFKEEEPLETSGEVFALLAQDDESSSEDEALPIGGMGAFRRKGKGSVVLRGNKNLVEPRTSQGVFGPNGELVCFFRDPTRVVRNVVRGLSDSPATPAEPMTPPPPPPAEEDPPQSLRIFQSPSLISDAVRRLALSSSDRQPRNIEIRKAGDKNNNILRIMTNLLTFSQSQQKSHHKEGETKPLGEILKSYALLSATPRRSMIFLASTLNLAGSDKVVAVDYIFTSDVSLSDACQKNAVFARNHGRTDHERTFRTLDAVFASTSSEDSPFSSLAIKVIQELYSDFAKNKDIQMLAMLSVFVLQWYQSNDVHITINTLPTTQSSHRSPIGIPSLPSSPAGNDYFSLHRALNERPPRSRLPSNKSSPGTSHIMQPMSMLSTSTSSRGSWSSLFNTGTMRNFMAGVGDSLKEGLGSPLEFPTMGSNPDTPTPIPTVKVENTEKDPSGQRKPGRKGRKEPSIGSGSGTGTGANKISPGSSKWGVEVKRPSRISASSSTSSNNRPSPLSFVPSSSEVGNGNGLDKPRRIVFHDVPAQVKHQRPQPPFTPSQIRQLRTHITVYADLLNRWQLYTKRLELLKSIKQPHSHTSHSSSSFSSAAFSAPFPTSPLTRSGRSALNTANTTNPNANPDQIGIQRACRVCASILGPKAGSCQSCGAPGGSPGCTICRLPVKGLSKSCLKCLHVTHISCWSSLDALVCPTGCGCVCTNIAFEDPSGLGGGPLSSSINGQYAQGQGQYGAYGGYGGGGGGQYSASGQYGMVSPSLSTAYPAYMDLMLS